MDDLGRFVVRLPYAYHNDDNATRTPAPDSSHLAFHALGELVKQDSPQGSDLRVQCNLCKASMLLPRSIENVRPLPTGFLDEVKFDAFLRRLQ